MPQARDPSAVLSEAVALHSAGRLPEAERLYLSILGEDPGHADALSMLGAIHIARGHPARALELIDASLARVPRQPVAQNNRGVALLALDRVADALNAFRIAISIAPEFVEAYRNCGRTLYLLGRSPEALDLHDRALALAPRDAQLLSTRAVILWSLKRHDEALDSCDRAIGLAPGSAEAHDNRGLVLSALHRLDEAVASYDRAVAIAPDHAATHNNRAVALTELARFDEALDACERALAIKPDFANAFYNRGIALKELKRHGESLACFDKAASLGAQIPYLDGERLFARMQLCDWRDFESLRSRITAGIESGKRVIHPFALLPVPSNAGLQRRCAEIYVADRCPPTAVPRPSRVHSHERIRLAYFSADFHEHATAFLAAELFERHDRSRFEVIAFSFGLPSKGGMRQRLEAAFDRFIDVRSRSDGEIAELSRSLEVDIAVDLKGFTQDSRPGIFARRAAPVQVSYLGFPGTMGASYIDHIVADAIVIPPGQESHYAENVLRLPNSYQANDSRRRVSGETQSREAAGLPPGAFVYCCFNNPCKITPDAFAVWMRLLDRARDSVIWLMGGETMAVENLRREARERGVDPRRLVFAAPVENSRHLARLRLADLFLDTFHYGAHTTASDALWAGLPVLTCPGDPFASRVAASLLHAAGLPQLVAESPDEYELIAERLANDPQELDALRASLRMRPSTLPLFDIERFTRDLESAYVRIAPQGS